jgi:hypothetical protein
LETGAIITAPPASHDQIAVPVARPFDMASNDVFRPLQPLEANHGHRGGFHLAMLDAAMGEDQLLRRADEAIAESQRLIDELRRSMLRAQELDDHLNYLHWLRIEDARLKR